MNFFPIEQLHELFRLDPETGKLFWRNAAGRWGRIKAGSEAGTLNARGYRQIQIINKLYKAHRMVFAMTHGRWPEPEADHRNGVKDDNRPENLREATSSQNKQNTSKRQNNTSGVKGVSWNRRNKKWDSQIAVAGKTIHLGSYADLETARQVRMKAALKYHGEFANMAST